MISRVNSDFLEAYANLDRKIRRKVQRAYQLFMNNPHRGSLHFRRIRSRANVYSVRIDDNYRALGELEENVITRFRVGPHDEYERLIS